MNRRQALAAAVALGAAILPDAVLGPAQREAAESLEITRLRDVLLSYGPSSGPDVGVVDFLALRRSVATAWAAFQACRYWDLNGMLPGLIAACQAGLHGAEAGRGDERATDLLSQVYQLAVFDLTKRGEGQLALLAADRGMLAAEQAGEELGVAACARVLAAALLSAGQAAKAKQVCIGFATPLQERLGAGSAAEVSVYGALHLKGAVAAARLGDRASTQGFLEEARAAARRLGGDANHYWTAFGPTNVAVHQVAVAVELGDGGTAVERAKQVRIAALPSMERRAQHLIEVACGYGQWGKNRQATDLLVAAERLAPEEVRVQPKVTTLVAELLHRDRRRNPDLRALAHRVGAAT
jgi:hypothetical protein